MKMNFKKTMEIILGCIQKNPLPSLCVRGSNW